MSWSCHQGIEALQCWGCLLEWVFRPGWFPCHSWYKGNKLLVLPKPTSLLKLRFLRRFVNLQGWIGTESKFELSEHTWEAWLAQHMVLPHCKDFRDDPAVGKHPQSQVSALGGVGELLITPACPTEPQEPPQHGAKAAAAALLGSPFAQPSLGRNSWQFQPGLAAHPAVPGCGRGSSSLTHGSCTLGQILGCGSPQEPAIPSSAFPGHWGWLVPAPASPGTRKVVPGPQGEAGWGSALPWEEDLPPLCSLPELCAWQDPQAGPPQSQPPSGSPCHTPGVSPGSPRLGLGLGMP